MTGLEAGTAAMATQSLPKIVGAVLVVALAIVCGGVIAMGFLAPERLFDSDAGLAAFLLAGAVMVPLAVIANLYDLKGILADALP